MDRRAFNPAGRLGCFYNASRDEIIEQQKLGVEERLSSFSSPHCDLIKGNDNANFNILQLIGVENELILSTLLKTRRKRLGIAQVLHYPHCIDDGTRFLCYSWMCRKQELFKKTQETIEIANPPKNATHVITNIIFGIDLIVIVQLPSESDIRHKIDSKLEMVCNALSKDKKGILALPFDDLKIKVYSNIPLFTGLVDISDVLYQINTIRRNAFSSTPIFYHLEPIASFYPTQINHYDLYSPLSKELIDGLEQYVLQVRNRIKCVETSLNENIPKLFSGHLRSLLNEAQNRYLAVKQVFFQEMSRLFKLVQAVRQDKKKNALEQINQALLDIETSVMQKSIDELNQHVNKLISKGQFIIDLQQDHFEYWNFTESRLRTCHHLEAIEGMLIRMNSPHRVLCSNDILNPNNQSELNQLRQVLIKEQETQPTLRLIYLDFSYSSFPLQKMTLIPSLDVNHRETQVLQPGSLLEYTLQSSTNIPPVQSGTDEIINVLLLGETGVGKSAFINAFVNYLTYNSLEEAQTDEPIVLIPASFTMTTGDHFEEQTITFGEFDTINHESFKTVGHSVTQHCRSYLFTPRQCDGKRLRIIDTPGFGDPRSLEQVDQNMEDILQYINHLTHLSAICFLLKPNSSRLNVFFRACLTQLFAFLSPAARKILIFCFTNARSTFYTPGDTAPLLKTMLQSLPIKDIRFEKENTFCFDSESFHYLVALQNEVSFTEDDKREYAISWSTSANESNRLLDYIQKRISIYQLKNGCQSIKNARFEISYMIRPILETMRNILRNVTLCKKGLPDEFIELHCKAVHHTATRCLSCKEEPQPAGQFWIIPTVLHDIQGNCHVCSCPRDLHVRMYYMIEYRYLHNASNRHENATNDILEELGSASVRFALFLQNTSDTINDDPFLMGLAQMIDEEKEICQNQIPNNFNSYLMKNLTKLRELYELYKQKITEKKSNQKPLDLSDVYQSIETVGKYSMVHEQMVALKQSQQMMLKDREHEVETI